MLLTVFGQTIGHIYVQSKNKTMKHFEFAAAVTRTVLYSQDPWQKSCLSHKIDY